MKDSWDAEAKEAKQLARKYRGKLKRCPACLRGTLERLWPKTDDFPEEEYGYTCGAVITKRGNTLSAGDLDVGGNCEWALSEALEHFNRGVRR
jgi:hypothetical protein